MKKDERISKELTKMLDEQERVNELINLFILGLFLVLVMYLYVI